jgi:hypothetical protein
MGCDITKNNCVYKCDFLDKQTLKIGSWLKDHSTIFKITLVIMHLFRAGAMVGLMFIPGVPLIPALVVGFVGSIIYRLTVERKCAFKFALPSFAGAAAFMLALPAIINMVNGISFVNATAGVIACASLLPLALYCVYIVLSVNHEVNTLPPEAEEDCHCEKETPQV